MISRYNVYLNDVSLRSVDDSIYIDDIAYQSASQDHIANRLVGRNGAYSYGAYIKESKVTVSFMLRQYQTENRQSVMQSIIGWCVNGGWLKTSDRPNQRMYVVCTKLPSVTSVKQWLGNLTIEFTAYDYPFWMDEQPERVVLTQGNTASVFVSGVYKTDVEAVITPGATMEGFTITCAGTSIELSDINIPQGQDVRISYTDDHHILKIESNGVSLLDKRTADSDDDLVLSPGMNSVEFDCESSATCTLLIRGVYI